MENLHYYSEEELINHNDIDYVCEVEASGVNIFSPSTHDCQAESEIIHKYGAVVSATYYDEDNNEYAVDGSTLEELTELLDVEELLESTI